MCSIMFILYLKLHRTAQLFFFSNPFQEKEYKNVVTHVRVVKEELSISEFSLSQLLSTIKTLRD